MTKPTMTDNQNQVIRDGMRQVGENFLSEFSPFKQATRPVVMWLLSLFSNSVEVLLRRNFGERYFYLSSLLSSAVLFLVLRALAGFEANVLDLLGFGWLFRPTWLSTVFLLVFLGFGFFHYWVIYLRFWRSEDYHTRAVGQSWLHRWTHPLRVPIAKRLKRDVPHQQVTQHYLEPLLVFALSLVVPDGFLRLWLWLAALALLIKENIRHQAFRDQYNNIRDAQIEGEAWGRLARDGFGAIREENSTVVPSYTVKGFTAVVPLPMATEVNRAKALATLRIMRPKEVSAAEAEEAARLAEQAATLSEHRRKEASD